MFLKYNGSVYQSGISLLIGFLSLKTEAMNDNRKSIDLLDNLVQGE